MCGYYILHISRLKNQTGWLSLQRLWILFKMKILIFNRISKEQKKRGFINALIHVFFFFFFFKLIDKYYPFKNQQNHAKKKKKTHYIYYASVSKNILYSNCCFMRLHVFILVRM